MSSYQGPEASATMLRTSTRLTQALLGGLVVIFVAVAFVVPAEQRTAMPPVNMLLLVLLLLAAAEVLIEAIGYRTPAIAPGTPLEEAMASSKVMFQSAMILRFAMSEAVTIIAIALVFVYEDAGLVTLGVAAVGTAVLILVHVWPNQRNISRTQTSLERDGGSSFLPEALEGPPPPRA